MMKYALLASVAIAAFAVPATAGEPLATGIEPGSAKDCARMDPSKTLDLIRRIKDAGGVVVAS